MQLTLLALLDYAQYNTIMSHSIAVQEKIEEKKKEKVCLLELEKKGAQIHSEAGRVIPVKTLSQGKSILQRRVKRLVKGH